MSEYNHRDRSGPCFEKRYLWCTVIVLLISNFRSRANFNETEQVKVSNNFSIRIPQNYTKWSIKTHLRSITYSKINQKGRGPFPKTAVKIVHPLPLMAKSQFLGQWKKNDKIPWSYPSIHILFSMEMWGKTTHCAVILVFSTKFHDLSWPVE